MKWFWKGSKCGSKKNNKNHLICIVDFKCVARLQKVDWILLISYIVYNQIYLNIFKGDFSFSTT
jgi:hypothetical protein